MNLRSTFTRPTRSALTAITLIGIAMLAIGWTAGTVAASTGSRAAAPTAAPTAVLPGPVNLPDLATTTTPGAAGVTTGSSGTATSIAYPVPGYDSLGTAPQGTILAQGTGQADMKANGSNEAAALQKATAAALAGAHTQALAAAAAMGVQLQGTYSVSIATNTNYIYPTPDCVVPPVAPAPASGAAGTTGSAPASSPEICLQVNSSTPTSAQLVVTLIVAYKYA